MKNRKVTYLLIFVTSLIWGYVILQIVDAASGDSQVVSFTPLQVDNPGSERESFSFDLLEYRRDPFLGIVKKDRPKVVVKKITKPKPVTKEPEKKDPPVDFSFIQFRGIIENQERGKKIALVSVSGKDYTVIPGDTIQGVVFLENLKDSLKVTYLGQSSYIRKK